MSLSEHSQYSALTASFLPCALSWCTEPPSHVQPCGQSKCAMQKEDSCAMSDDMQTCDAILEESMSYTDTFIPQATSTPKHGKCPNKKVLS